MLRSSYYTLDEVLEEDGDADEAEESLNDDVDNDPDWEKTPLCKRIRKLRETSNTTLLSFGGGGGGEAGNGVKRKTPSASEEDSDDGGAEFPKPKRFSGPPR